MFAKKQHGAKIQPYAKCIQCGFLWHQQVLQNVSEHSYISANNVQDSNCHLNRNRNFSSIRNILLGMCAKTILKETNETIKTILIPG